MRGSIQSGDYLRLEDGIYDDDDDDDDVVVGRGSIQGGKDDKYSGASSSGRQTPFVAAAFNIMNAILVRTVCVSVCVRGVACMYACV